MRSRPPLRVLAPILGALGAIAIASDRPTSGSPFDAAPRLKVSRPTPVYALPLAKSRLLLTLRAGEEVRVFAGALRTGASIAPPPPRPFGSDFYDPDLSTDVVDRVSEGYTPVFHSLPGAGGSPLSDGATRGPGASPPGLAAPKIGSMGAIDCTRPPVDGCAAPALREPDNIGTWVQVLLPDGKQRGWVLIPLRPDAARPPAGMR